MSLASMIAGFYLLIFHFLFAIFVANRRYADGSGASSTYNHSRKQEMRNSRNDGIFAMNQNTSKSNTNSPDFVEKIVDQVLWDYLTTQATTGYYTIQSTGARMFYVFLKPQDQVYSPVVLWLNGGPGYSSNIGLFYENGPFKFGDDLSLVANNNGWNRLSNIIYVDQPIGTGFSYVNNDYEIRLTLDDVTNDLYDFLQVFFNDGRHQNYATNSFFIAGESYAGHYAPALALKIIEENNAGRRIKINLWGVAIGNPLIDLGIQYGSIPYFAYNLNKIITQQDKQIIKEQVKLCEASVQGCGTGNETACHEAFDDCYRVLAKTTTASRVNYLNIEEDVDSGKYDFAKMVALLNQQDVKTMLGVPVDKEFTLYNMNVFNALKADWAKSYQHTVSTILHQYGVKVLIYTGELDLQNTFLGTMRCARQLQWYGTDGFKNITGFIPFMVDGVEEGHQYTYQQLTVITVKKAGQMVPIDSPRMAFVMMHRWMRGDF